MNLGPQIFPDLWVLPIFLNEIFWLHWIPLVLQIVIFCFFEAISHTISAYSRPAVLLFGSSRSQGVLFFDTSPSWHFRTVCWGNEGCYIHLENISWSTTSKTGPLTNCNIKAFLRFVKRLSTLSNRVEIF